MCPTRTCCSSSGRRGWPPASAIRGSSPPASCSSGHSRRQVTPFRWAGLSDGELPGFTFTPTLGADPSQALLIQGPLPGTSFGECTLIQPTAGEDGLNGLITVAGHAAELDAPTQGLIRAVGDEM